MKKLLTLLIVSILVITGCSAQVDKTPTEITIVHDLGETAAMTYPEKIVVFDMGILDMLDALEIPVAAVPQANVPTSLEKYTSSDYVNAGTLFEPDFETLAEMAPDLIIISGRASSNYEELSKIAPTISLALSTEDFTGSVVDHLEVIQQLFPDREKDIQADIDDLTASISAIQTKASALDDKVLFILANGDSISAFGSGGRFGMVYDDFGFKNIDADVESSTHGQQISFEFIADNNPDVILVMDRGVIVGAEIAAKDLLDNDLVNSTNAAKNGKIIYLDPEVWYLTTGGLNATKTMISELSALVD